MCMALSITRSASTMNSENKKATQFYKNGTYMNSNTELGKIILADYDLLIF